jgi:hypothetical protein
MPEGGCLSGDGARLSPPSMRPYRVRIRCVKGCDGRSVPDLASKRPVLRWLQTSSLPACRSVRGTATSGSTALVRCLQHYLSVSTPEDGASASSFARRAPATKKRMSKTTPARAATNMIGKKSPRTIPKAINAKAAKSMSHVCPLQPFGKRATPRSSSVRVRAIVGAGTRTLTAAWSSSSRTEKDRDAAPPPRWLRRRRLGCFTMVTSAHADVPVV